jgi:hypothetical protein
MQELREVFSSLEIVEQGSDGHASPDKYWGSAQDVWVSMDDVGQHIRGGAVCGDDGDLSDRHTDVDSCEMQDSRRVTFVAHCGLRLDALGC